MLVVGRLLLLCMTQRDRLCSGISLCFMCCCLAQLLMIHVWWEVVVVVVYPVCSRQASARLLAPVVWPSTSFLGAGMHRTVACTACEYAAETMKAHPGGCVRPAQLPEQASNPDGLAEQ